MTPSPCLRRFPAALFLLPLFLNSCGGPSYKGERLEEAVRDICRREYQFDLSARRVGKTLYAAIEPQHIVGVDLGLDRKTIERLYDALLTVTRVALSTDVPIDYLVVKAKDANTGVTLTLLRYLPDIKYYFYMRISRADFEKRGVLEIDGADEPDDPKSWHDVSPEEFMARLAASSLQQKITYNPLVSVFVRVHRVKGSFRGGTLSIRLDKFQRLPGGGGEGSEASGTPETSDEMVRRSVVEDVGNILKKYDEGKSVRRVRVVEENGRALMDLSREELLEARAKMPVKKLLGIPVEDE